MAKEGDTMTSYCNKCEHETTWAYCIYMLGKEIWECKECGGRRYVAIKSVVETPRRGVSTGGLS